MSTLLNAARIIKEVSLYNLRPKITTDIGGGKQGYFSDMSDAQRRAWLKVAGSQVDENGERWDAVNITIDRGLPMQVEPPKKSYTKYILIGLAALAGLYVLKNRGK